jgi:hypothetical protein
MDAAWATFRTLLDQAQPYEVSQMLRNFSVPDEIIAEMTRRHEVEATRFLTLGEPLGVHRENAEPWYAGPRPGDKNWPAFEAHLRRTLDAEAVDKIHAASDKVVAMLDHPAKPAFASRGLVVGHVQSGKTSNFTAVICKAADRGYRMFIVLSGIHNSLRRQTQSRLIRDVVDLNPTLWHQITKLEHDFVPPANAASLLASRDQSLLLVVKKNAVVLRKLRKWLKGAREHLDNCPVLIIDDEADQATIATKTINPLIKDALASLPRSCYVGYTATPFANLLADPASDKDFYPKDFVLSLPRGADYQGPETLFGRSPLDGEDPSEVPGGLDMIRVVPADEIADLRPAKKADVPTFEPAMTPSLRRAVLWFWLASAARRLRGQVNQHSSMLIHAHSDTAVHDSYRAPLESFRVRVSAGLAGADEGLLDELEALWAEESARVPQLVEHHFDDLAPFIQEAVSDTKIVMDHYRSADRLDYGSGPVTVIAVGGNTLSRGLTLEGLVVSVFVRSSDVYDTLLQMGRWFGYRPGYADLPRIYMPDEMRRWFTHLATVEAEMRREIERYLVEHKTPLELAVRIRCHPKMRVTAPAKQGNGVKAAASYGGQLVETRYFVSGPKEAAPKWHAANAAAVGTLLNAAASLEERRDHGVPSGRALWRDVSVEEILRFIEAYNFHEMSTDASPDLLRRYIEKRMSKGALINWNIGLVGNSDATEDVQVDLPGGLRLGLVNRSRLSSAGADDEVADIKTLTGSRDEAIDLDISHLPRDKVNRTTLLRTRMEQQPGKGLLLLYPIDAKSKALREGRAPLAIPGEVVWGVAFVFPNPGLGADLEVEYDYVASDLSRVFPSAIEDELADAAVLSQDLDSGLEPVG